MAYDETTPFELVAIVGAMFGRVMADRIEAKLAGIQILVPQKWSARNSLCQILGRARFDLLADQIGGVKFEVPMGLTRNRKLRLIIRLSRQGVSPSRIAAQVGLCERRVYQLRRKLREQGILPLHAGTIARAINTHKSREPGE